MAAGSRRARSSRAAKNVQQRVAPSVLGHIHHAQDGVIIVPKHDGDPLPARLVEKIRSEIPAVLHIDNALCRHALGAKRDGIFCLVHRKLNLPSDCPSAELQLHPERHRPSAAQPGHDVCGGKASVVHELRRVGSTAMLQEGKRLQRGTLPGRVIPNDDSERGKRNRCPVQALEVIDSQLLNHFTPSPSFPSTLAFSRSTIAVLSCAVCRHGSGRMPISPRPPLPFTCPGSAIARDIAVNSSPPPTSPRCR